MALHRDIFWIGRQWAVTGHGMQLIDQRLMGAFDIEVARLWDDDLIRFERDPNLAAIRNDPAFRAIISRVEEDLRQQRDQVLKSRK